jgi:hypothetical protein
MNPGKTALERVRRMAPDKGRFRGIKALDRGQCLKNAAPTWSSGLRASAMSPAAIALSRRLVARVSGQGLTAEDLSCRVIKAELR